MLQNKNVLLCLSHLRWNFVFQRPQHLMSRFANEYQVFYMEEPIFIDAENPSLVIHENNPKLFILIPYIPHLFSQEKIEAAQRKLLDEYFTENNFSLSVLWYLTPMSLKWTEHLNPKVTVYDCMDELSAFKNAPSELKEYEQRLLKRADLVFTGGMSLYEAKRNFHAATYLFPSSVDVAHFGQARTALKEPEDQSAIPHPRLGFYGVIDERLDIQLIEMLAKACPEWSFILIGPVVKIDPATLPQRQNIYYLGSKTYQDLPFYLASWEVALIPFAINDATRFISPTKTPEYLAGGKPVVSTPIIDIVKTYGTSKIVHIADPRHVAEFIQAIEKALIDAQNPAEVCFMADYLLKDMSWDKTYLQMEQLISNVRITKKGIL